jgi:nucleotide-binding universal stress UspA family protein
MSVLVTLATYQKPKTAYFLKQNLEKLNIDCFLSFSAMSVEHPDEIRVRVKDMDVEPAIKIMLDLKERYGRNIEEIEPDITKTRIVVPVDFSPEAENACYYAVHLANLLKAEIKVLHIYENPVQDMHIKRTSTYEDYIKEIHDEAESKASSQIIAFTEKIRDYKNTREFEEVKIHSSVDMGDPIKKIRKISKDYNPDFIILGTSPETNGSENKLAGKAHEIIRSLDVPVCAIPVTCKAEKIERMNVLYATDFNEKDHTSLNKLLSILKMPQKSISCIHIDTAHNPSSKERMDVLNEFLGLEYSEHDIRCSLIEDRDVFHGIKEFASKYNINLLSFTSRKRGIFDKLTKPNLFKKILQDANLPILVFPS